LRRELEGGLVARAGFSPAVRRVHRVSRCFRRL